VGFVAIVQVRQFIHVKKRFLPASEKFSFPDENVSAAEINRDLPAGAVDVQDAALPAQSGP